MRVVLSSVGSSLCVFRWCPSQTSLNGTQRYALSTKATGWSGSSSAQLTTLNKRGMGTGDCDKLSAIWDDSVCFFSPPCGSDKGEKKSFWGLLSLTRNTRVRGRFRKVQRAPRLRATQTHTPGWQTWRIRCTLLCRPGTEAWSGKLYIGKLITSMKWAAGK